MFFMGAYGPAERRGLTLTHCARYDVPFSKGFPPERQYFKALDGIETIWIGVHNMKVKWSVVFHPEFEPEFDRLDEDVQDELLAQANLLEELGPLLGRPRVDTLNGSAHANMKELRFDASDGVWRVAFAFDPEKQAILLVAGDKSGTNEKRFYKRLVARADERFDDHLRGLKEKGKRK